MTETYLTKDELKLELNELNGYSKDFASKYYTGCIEDDIQEFADFVTQFDYSDKFEYLKKHLKEVEAIITEEGWKGVNCSIKTAIIRAKHNEIYNEIRKNIVSIIENYAINYIIDHDLKVTKPTLNHIINKMYGFIYFEEIENEIKECIREAE